MSYATFIELLRITNALVATVVFGVLMFRTTRFWKRYDGQQKALVVSFSAYVTATAYTSFELYAQEASTGFYSYIVFVANAITIWAFSMNKKPGLMTFNEYAYKLKYPNDGV